MGIVLSGRTPIPVRCPDLSPFFLTLTRTPGVWAYSSHFGTRRRVDVPTCRRFPVLLSPLPATLMHLPASVANKRLTARLSSLDTTLTKKRGRVANASPTHKV